MNGRDPERRRRGSSLCEMPQNHSGLGRPDRTSAGVALRVGVVLGDIPNGAEFSFLPPVPHTSPTSVPIHGPGIFRGGRSTSGPSSPDLTQEIYQGEQEGRARPQSQSGIGSQGVAPAAWLASRFSLRAVGEGGGGAGSGHTGNQKTTLTASVRKLDS